jgi:pectinesterase
LKVKKEYQMKLLRALIAFTIGLGGLAAATAHARPTGAITLNVSPHGRFHSIQAAINAAPEHSQTEVIIKIAPGKYRELVTVPSPDSHLELMGAGIKKTIITYNLGARDKNKSGHELGTFHTPTVTILGRHIEVSDLTIANTFGKGSQAVAVRTGDGPVAFHHCRFLGWQDTVYVHNPHARIYFGHCIIAGAIDFIFGKSYAVFNHCLIRCLGEGCITAPATPKRQKYGLVFLHCRIIAGKGVSQGVVHLGRPWRKYGYSAFVDCYMGRQIAPAGWLNWNHTNYYKTARFYEFHSTGPGADASARVPWSHQLSSAQAKLITVKAVLGPGRW